jgi:predicted ATPase
LIDTIRIVGFKSLRDVRLKLGRLNLFVGTNASGKSNLFDALRVVQGIGYGFTIDEILNGKPRSATSEVWAPIRGGSTKADYVPLEARAEDRGDARDEEAVISFEVTLADECEGRGRKANRIEYAIGFSAASGAVRREALRCGRREIFNSAPVANPPDKPVFEVRYYKGKVGGPPHLKFEKSRSVLHQLLQHRECIQEHREILGRCIAALSDMQRIDPSPAVLRDYSRAYAVRRMGEHGENFAALVATILSDEAAGAAYLSWLLRLTPAEFDEVAVLKGALGEPLFAVKEKGVSFPAPVLSDGTLRFAAIAAALFQPDAPGVITIEEIENGIHAGRLRLLVELLRSKSAAGCQVMATTHSPIVLAWLREADYDTTFFCKRDESTGASRIAPLSQVPHFLEIVKRTPISDLFAEGWLEAAL